MRGHGSGMTACLWRDDTGWLPQVLRLEPRGGGVVIARTNRAPPLLTLAALALTACRELTLPPVAAEPVAVAGGLRFLTVSSGALHTCGVSATGTTYCWGWNRDGELGDGSRTDRSSPVPVSSPVAFSAIAAGGGHTCGLGAGGAGYCWGRNSFGQLGDSTLADTTRPAAVRGGLKFTSLAVGFSHTCGLTANGSAYCWGDNQLGQLGDTVVGQSTAPMLVGGGLVF